MGDDSQFRDHAANERTLLAWSRTGVALMAFGFAIARFGLFLREMARAAPPSAPPGEVASSGSGWLGVVLVLFGLTINLAALIRYLRVREGLIARRTMVPRATLAYVLGIGSALLALTMATMLSRTLGH